MAGVGAFISVLLLNGRPPNMHGFCACYALLHRPLMKERDSRAQPITTAVLASFPFLFFETKV